MAKLFTSRKSTIRYGFLSNLFDVANVLFFVILAMMMILPFWNVFIVSISTIGEYMRTPFYLWPKTPTIAAYKYVFSSSLIPRAYLVTIAVTVCGTITNVLVTSMMAYSLSKKRLHGRNFFLLMILFTMFFSGGLIPSYMIIRNVLKLNNTFFVMFIPSAVSAYNFVIMKSFFTQMPESLEESAKLDGANDLFIFFRIIYPLSIPMLSTMALFAAVGYWNSWFMAHIYIVNKALYPLQLIIRNYILKVNLPPEIREAMGSLRDPAGNPIPVFEEGLKMSTVVIAIVPLLLIYPWMQKYFEKGVMIGSIKG